MLIIVLSFLIKNLQPGPDYNVKEEEEWWNAQAQKSSEEPQNPRPKPKAKKSPKD